jgi:GNAT superfamily N-acetyltransferase
MLDVSIRAAGPKDAPLLAPLCQVLGHAPPLSEVKAALEGPAEAHHALLVAVSKARVVGFVELEARGTLGSGRWAEMTALAVEVAHRGQGVGGALVEASRAWARSRGLRRLRVRTRSERREAARFYEGKGFRLSKEQRVYDAALDAEG